MKKRTLIIGAGVLLALGLASCGSDGDKDSNVTTSSSTSVISSSKKTQNKLTKANFDKITIGENGYTPEQTEELFGKKANTTSDSTVENISTSMHIWNNIDDGKLGSNITIQYENGHAISKTITGLKNKPKADLNDETFNSIQNGMSKNDVINKLGEPSGYTYTEIGGIESETLSYDQTENGKTKTIDVTIQNGSVTGKNQTSI